MVIKVVALVLYVFLIDFANGETLNYKFVIESTCYSRLCSRKEILTVNGEFPGPTIKAHRGDKIVINVYNNAKYNMTIHWHGLRQLRNPWADGPEYISQCPIRTGNDYTYNIKISREEGTVWWHAHSGWARATVHGAIIIYPKLGFHYPFPNPHEEIPIILGEWWKKDVMEVAMNANRSGGEPMVSDAYTINGQPGHLYPCSQSGVFKVSVESGKRYLLRIISAIMNENMFFGIAKHNITLVGKDGLYLKPINSEYIMITPGQSMDVLFEANQSPNSLYFMAARTYSSATAAFDNTTTTAIIQYLKPESNQTLNSNPNPKPKPVDSETELHSYFPYRSLYVKREAFTDFMEQTPNPKPDNSGIELHPYFPNIPTHSIIQTFSGQLNETLNPNSKPDGSGIKLQPYFPNLPPYDRTEASTDFTKQFRSLASKQHPANVPLQVDINLFFTLSVNLVNCTKNSCKGPRGRRLAASFNNISFIAPSIDILRAYYYNISGVYEDDFPRYPPREFNYTGEKLPENLLTPAYGTKVVKLKYNSSVELILQGTNVLVSENHPIHMHGYGFYVVGWNFGNFDPKKDHLMYNLVDPPEETTVGVPKNGWVAIRFIANNPGVWFMHCHLERHQMWGMSIVFIVENGDDPNTQIIPPPQDLPTC